MPRTFVAYQTPNPLTMATKGGLLLILGSYHTLPHRAGNGTLPGECPPW